VIAGVHASEAEGGTLEEFIPLILICRKFGLFFRRQLEHFDIRQCMRVGLAGWVAVVL
jgi:hypothetical protein